MMLVLSQKSLHLSVPQGFVDGPIFYWAYARPLKTIAYNHNIKIIGMQMTMHYLNSAYLDPEKVKGGNNYHQRLLNRCKRLIVFSLRQQII
jgi:hypothetical protein